MDLDQLMKAAVHSHQATAASSAPAKEVTTTTGVPAAGPSEAPGLDIDALVADIRSSPLFMNELDTESEAVQALQALAFEGTPLENALSFKDQGNELFVAKRHADAREFYGKVVALLAPLEAKRQRGEVTTHVERAEDEREVEVEDDEDEIRGQKAALEAAYVNRAACELEMRNYRACWLDCGRALLVNPRNVKAYYRSSRALLAVGRLEDADDSCKRGVAVDPANKPLQGVAKEIAAAISKRDAKRKADEERAAKERRKEAVLSAALKARNIVTRSTGSPPEMGDVKVRLVPDEEDPRSSLVVPVVLLYPTDMETDFIKEFGEADALGEHLGYVFPLPWDSKGRYTVDGVECYVETAAGGLVKWGKNVPLLKVLGTGKVEVVDDVLKVFVLPRGEAAAWVADFKEKKAATRK